MSAPRFAGRLRFGTIWDILRRLVGPFDYAKRRCCIFNWLAVGENMDSAYVPALAAFGGSAVGGLTSLVATWVTQRRKDSVRSLAQEKARRQKLYKQFIDEASKLYADALVHDESAVSSLVHMYALIGRMRILSSGAVIGKAEAAARMIYRYVFLAKQNIFRIEAVDGQPLDGSVARVWRGLSQRIERTEIKLSNASRSRVG
jgi:hypothetical protein